MKIVIILVGLFIVLISLWRNFDFTNGDFSLFFRLDPSSNFNNFVIYFFIFLCTYLTVMIMIFLLNLLLNKQSSSLILSALSLRLFCHVLGFVLNASYTEFFEYIIKVGITEFLFGIPHLLVSYNSDHSILFKNFKSNIILQLLILIIIDAFFLFFDLSFSQSLRYIFFIKELNLIQIQSFQFLVFNIRNFLRYLINKLSIVNKKEIFFNTKILILIDSSFIIYIYFMYSFYFEAYSLKTPEAKIIFCKSVLNSLYIYLLYISLIALIHFSDEIVNQNRAFQEIKEGNISDLKIEDKDCGICLEKIAISKILGCGHIFHPDCLKSWMFSGNKHCPKCFLRIKRNPQMQRALSSQIYDNTSRIHPQINGLNFSSNAYN